MALEYNINIIGGSHPTRAEDGDIQTIAYVALRDILSRRSGPLRAVTVDVIDSGAAAANVAASGGGHGLVGMRERVAVYAGSLHAGPDPHGGFAVHARLPLWSSA